MACEEVLQHNDPYKAFSEALLNFHSHYCKNLHDSVWYKFHPATANDGSPYSIKFPLLCATQADVFLELLQSMVAKPQDYTTPSGKVTTNVVEGFHGLALKYRGKRIDLWHMHYCCKTNMAMCYKNLGPIWKLVSLCKMGVDVPEQAVSAILAEQDLWSYYRQRRHKNAYYHYRSLLKSKTTKRHSAEKDHMIHLRAVGTTTAEYTRPCSTAETVDSID